MCVRVDRLIDNFYQETIVTCETKGVVEFLYAKDIFCNVLLIFAFTTASRIYFVCEGGRFCVHKARSMNQQEYRCGFELIIYKLRESPY